MCDELLDIVFPHLESVLVERVCVEGEVVRVAARTRDGTALPCPDCGSPSVRVHSRYQRHLADTAVGGRSVVIDLTVRRLFCDVPACPRRTFVEQVAGLTLRYGRYTPSLLGPLQAVGLALAGRAGARLLAVLHAMVSRVTLISLVMAVAEPVLRCPRVLGVDDFAFKRGRVYGTVLIDGESHRPVDLLADREADTLAQWLGKHPGADVVCRDRAGAYADGARTGAPDAVQVADRWHLWHNLGAAVERCVSAHRDCLREPEAHAATPQELDPAPTAIAPDRSAHRFTDRIHERHSAVHALLEQGYALRAIGRELHLARHTVQRYARADTWQEMLHGQWQHCASELDPFKNYLCQRWAEGCNNAVTLHHELQERGFRGGYSQVRDYARHLRRYSVPARPPPPSVRAVTSWIMGHPDGLDADEHRQLKAILDRCPELTATQCHVQHFAKMLTQLRGGDLPRWLAAVRTDNLPGLNSFAHGIDSDLAAVTAGLTLPFSSGAVEGNVNRIKMLKRQMFGRAGFALLRKRVLLA